MTTYVLQKFGLVYLNPSVTQAIYKNQWLFKKYPKFLFYNSKILQMLMLKTVKNNLFFQQVT